MEPSTEIVVKMSYDHNNYTRFEFPIGINETYSIAARDTLTLGYMKKLFEALSKNYTTLNVIPSKRIVYNKQMINLKTIAAQFDANVVQLFILLSLLILITILGLFFSLKFYRRYYNMIERRRRRSHTCTTGNFHELTAKQIDTKMNQDREPFSNEDAFTNET